MNPEHILSRLGITNVITVNEDDTVEQALRLLDEKQVRAAPVIDKDGVFKGMFSTHEVIKSLVPSYMTDGFQSLDFAAGSGTVLASRLRRMFPTRVGNHVSCDDCVKITDSTNTWEALRLLTKYGSPLPVIEADTGVLKGILSEQSSIEALLKMDLEAEDLENDN